MKILITGNMGYIGPCVVDQLRSTREQAQIIGFDIGYFGSCISAKDRIPESRLNVQYFGDMRTIPAEILFDVDAVIHLAAISNDPMGDKFEDVTTDINYKASVDLAQKAKKAGVKAFVFASSCSMYGAADDSAQTEKSPLNPLTAYAKSKVRTEQNLEKMADKDFIVTCLRYATACGMSERLRLDLVLNDFVACAISSKRITILSDGTPWRPLINIKDMALAIDWAISRQADNGGEFLAVNVGCDEWNYQVKDLAEEVARIIPGVEVSINPDAPPDKRSYRVNFDLFNKLAPEHQPRINLATSIKELKEGMEALGFNDEKFRESDFMRLKHLTRLNEKGLLTSELTWVK